MSVTLWDMIPSWIGILGCWELMYIKDQNDELKPHWAKCFISGSCVRNISNFQLNECKYWHLEITLVVPPSEHLGNPTFGLQCLYKAKQQPSFWGQKLDSHPLYHHLHTLSTLMGHLSPHTVNPHGSIITSTHDVNKRNKICGVNVVPQWCRKMFW